MMTKVQKAAKASIALLKDIEKQLRKTKQIIVDADIHMAALDIYQAQGNLDHAKWVLKKVQKRI